MFKGPYNDTFYSQNPVDAFPRQGSSSRYPTNIDPALLSTGLPQGEKPCPTSITLFPINIHEITFSSIPGSQLQIKSNSSTPNKKRHLSLSDDEAPVVSPKRKRELKNEREAREKKCVSEKMLSENRAALPRDYRMFVESQIPERFGPRTKEIAGQNKDLDSKMFTADVMARSAVSLE